MVDYSRIKQITLDSIDRYVNKGIPTGGFLRAVLSNDLKGAFARADDENLKAMHDIVSYIYNEIPAPCQGNIEKVEAWIKLGGLEGIKKEK